MQNIKLFSCCFKIILSTFNTLHYFVYIHCVSLCNVLSLLHWMKLRILYYDSYVSSCSTCGHKILCERREGLLMSFEDGSVIHRAASWTDTAATHGVNCEAISVSLECFKFNGRVFTEPRLRASLGSSAEASVLVAQAIKKNLLTLFHLWFGAPKF